MAVRDRVTSPVALALPTPGPGHVVRSFVAPVVARLRAGFDGMSRRTPAAPRLSLKHISEPTTHTL
ncbi:hypothetical protein ACEN8K_43495, partial [Variovorax sp. CT11-76]